MIKYIVTTNSNLIRFNTETQDITLQDNQSFGIDWLWVAEEDGIINDQEVKIGDIILSMYSVEINSNIHNREIFVIKDEKLKDYYKRVIEFNKVQRQKINENCEAKQCCCNNCPMC